MMEVDMFETCVDRFEVIMPGLMASLLDKSILQEDKYEKIMVSNWDGPFGCGFVFLLFLLKRVLISYINLTNLLKIVLNQVT